VGQGWRVSRTATPWPCRTGGSSVASSDSGMASPPEPSTHVRVAWCSSHASSYRDTCRDKEKGGGLGRLPSAAPPPRAMHARMGACRGGPSSGHHAAMRPCSDGRDAWWPRQPITRPAAVPTRAERPRLRPSGGVACNAKLCHASRRHAPRTLTVLLVVPARCVAATRGRCGGPRATVPIAAHLYLPSPPLPPWHARRCWTPRRPTA
jgi:hypothetical protein